jgi:hypothetical protein
MERLADQGTVGKVVASPHGAGPFRLAGSKADPVTGDVALMIDRKPSGPTGSTRETL